jgi:hypothetical protein
MSRTAAFDAQVARQDAGELTQQALVGRFHERVPVVFELAHVACNRLMPR